MNTFRILPDVDYIIKKPERKFCVVIGVDVDFPLSNAPDEGLEDLKKAGFDLFFLFFPQTLNPSIRKINPLKFVSLYEGIGFRIADSKSVVHSFFEVGEYMATLKDTYVGVSYELLSTIGGFDPEEYTTLQNKYIAISTSPIYSPVLKVERRSPEELWEDYKEEIWPEEIEGEVELELPKIDYLTGAFVPSLPTQYPQEVDEDRRYATHKSPTLFPYLQLDLFSKLREKIDKTERGMEWWLTWGTSHDPKEFISSGISWFNLPHLNQDVLTLDLNPPKEVKTRKKNGKDLGTKGV